MYRWECQFCDESEQSTSQDPLKRHGKRHLKREHPDEVVEEFRHGYTDHSCSSGSCGYKFPSEYKEHPGLECPKCGSNHRSWYIGQLAYLGIEDAN